MHLILQVLLIAFLILRCDLMDLRCGKYNKKVSCRERVEILDVHNRFRQALALGILMRSNDSVVEFNSEYD
uniref:Putative secreted protein n=1 Tax=Panstrongylus lignarius TaxID=156445 RepID=A0A224XXW5_9HEMI